MSYWVFVTSKSVWKASWIIHHLEPHMFLLLEDNLHIFRMTLTRGTSSSITNRPFVKKNQSLVSPELKEKAAMRSNFDLDQKREVEEGDDEKEALKLPFISISNALLCGNSGLLRSQMHTVLFPRKSRWFRPAFRVEIDESFLRFFSLTLVLVDSILPVDV